MAYLNALLDQLDPTRPKNTGVSGIGLPGGTAAPPLETAPAPAPAAPSNQYRSQLEGFDFGKLDAKKQDPKYVFANLAQNYDVTNADQRSKLVDALRSDPSGFFKNASLDGDILHGSYNPDTGGYGDVDIIKGLKAGGQGWQWGAVDPNAAPQPTQGSKQMMPFGIGNLLSGDPSARIQGALNSYTQQSPYLAALLQSLGVS